jgi:putative Holliday junction resolvase
MKRYLGIDYGEKRVGLAITDPTRIIAQSLTVIENRSTKYLISEIKKILQEREISKIIVGLPLTLQGRDSKKTTEVREFVQKLAREVEIDIIFEDERFTTKIVHSRLRELGKKPSRLREKVDQHAAETILQLYIDRENRKNIREKY